MLAAARLGGKYAVALGGATAVYVLVDESVGWAREEYIGSRGAVVAQPVLEEEDIGDDEGLPRRRASWRKGGPEWEDGALAGGLLGAGVGTACESSHILYQHADMAERYSEALHPPYKWYKRRLGSCEKRKPGGPRWRRRNKHRSTVKYRRARVSRIGQMKGVVPGVV